MRRDVSPKLRAPSVGWEEHGSMGKDLEVVSDQVDLLRSFKRDGLPDRIEGFQADSRPILLTEEQPVAESAAKAYQQAFALSAAHPGRQIKKITERTSHTSLQQKNAANLLPNSLR